MRTEAASNPTCDHFGFSCRQRILPDLSNSDCLPGRAGGTVAHRCDHPPLADSTGRIALWRSVIYRAGALPERPTWALGGPE
jgi:hypothetical protein